MTTLVNLESGATVRGRFVSTGGETLLELEGGGAYTFADAKGKLELRDVPVQELADARRWAGME